MIQVSHAAAFLIGTFLEYMIYSGEYPVPSVDNHNPGVFAELVVQVSPSPSSLLPAARLCPVKEDFAWEEGRSRHGVRYRVP